MAQAVPSSLSSEAIDALVLLAARFEAEGNPLQAIHCLLALLKSRNLAPDQEARARLSLGRLLIDHTCNHKDALKELLKAVRGPCWG